MNAFTFFKDYPKKRHYTESDMCQFAEKYHEAKCALADVGESFIVCRGVPRFYYYWGNGEWIKDKAEATRYNWDEAKQLAEELDCTFTNAE